MSVANQVDYGQNVGSAPDVLAVTTYGHAKSTTSLHKRYREYDTCCKIQINI